LSDDESFCQDINECETYDNDDDEEDDDEEEENMPKATFCSHTCTNLIGLLYPNIYFADFFHVFIVQHEKFQEALFVPARRTFTFMTTNVHAFVTIVLIWTTLGSTKLNARTNVLTSTKVGCNRVEDFALLKMRFSSCSKKKTFKAIRADVQLASHYKMI
jgi:hypothetical protein